ncbi:PREDICTED: lisH domain and HEAT repeat-containing protein KIAA1468 homolog isoform X1 [Polistes dominula]|uniref:LisH domain and HEAT repeat-containing protein KIAA1468 homolog isoform X1 n=1 Tax=Polistes dominula TaxID=743375 RepID=A0ABM1J356_POLDO|nr:PREDICTED: lisH domain and HEAT repeat-containing protein KIAA1468 homolog isoform X1 [Polistes dominula]
MAGSIEEVRNPLSTNKGFSAVRSTVSYEEIATKLINEKFLLTALELHAELCEAGRELLILKEYFSNPNNFENQNIKPEPDTPMPRSSSQATLDSLDNMTRYSEDGTGVDERVAILEFELRNARESISALRANLTVVTEFDGVTPDKRSEKKVNNDNPIKPHEQRALNFLVHEYLLTHFYKLTSVTFSDENEDQDLEDWQDVGLNISKPSGLLQLYREYMRANGHDKPPSVNVSVQTEFGDNEVERKENELKEMEEQIEQLKQQTVSLEKEKMDLQHYIDTTNENLIQDNKQHSNDTIQSINSNSTTPDKFEILESPPRDVSNATQDPEEDDTVSVVVSLGETDPGDKEWTRIQLPRADVTEGSTILSNAPSRLMALSFKLEVLNLCLVDTVSDMIAVAEEPFKGEVSLDTFVKILAQTLPRIIPNIILNKREEVIPLIIGTVGLHSDSGEREKLLKLLFNLKKRPQEEERQMIIAGLVAMANLENEPIGGEEVLTLCWEQIQHKYPERRLLAVECCSALATFTIVSVRNSLTFSMLQQMLLDDKDPSVRASVVKCLALLVTLMDIPDKYFQCEELAFTALNDSSSIVVNTTTSIFLPVLAQWALSLKRFRSHLLPRLILKVKNRIKPINSQNSPVKDNIDEERIESLIGALQYLLPHTIVCVADTDIVKSFIEPSISIELPAEFLSICKCNIINPKLFYDNERHYVGSLLNTFFLYTWENDLWPELEWFTNKLIIDILEIVKSTEIVQESVINSLLTYIQSLCIGFGKYITQTRIQPIFLSEITELEKQLSTLSMDNKNLSLTLIPAYLIILSTLNGIEVSKSIKQFLVVLSMSGISITSLQIAIVKLCAKEEMQEHVLTGLWDGVVHQRSSVRCAVATLFGSVIAHTSDRLISGRIVPAIVTLASDQDIAVKASVIPPLGRLITECKLREARDKARLTLETIARESQNVLSVLATPLVSTLAYIAPSCPQSYIEDVIATQLTGITTTAIRRNRKVDLCNALVEAYSVLVYCPLSNQCISGVVLPGLRHLETLVNQSLPQQKETVKSLLREAESHQDIVKPIERSSSMSSGLSLSMATVNVGQGVEDMRQRMSKIFQQRPSSSTVTSIFKKK